jgi:gliding motility-associated-like protein
MGTETQQNTSNGTILIPNLKRWQFYIVAEYACGSGDSLVSDTLFVDDIEPVPMELDSVSVDIATQLIISGWQKNTSADLQGYLLYKVGATNQIIADTNTTQYSFRKLNPRVPGNRIAISAYDSCLQAGLISSYHEPVLLSIADSNYCKNSFSFRFSPYIGWPVLRYEVYIKPQGSPNFTRYTTLPSSGPFSFNISTPSKNTKHQCFVRAFHNNGLISSTSNLLIFGFDSLPSNTYSYIRRVTQNNQDLWINAVFDNPNGSIKDASIQVSENGSTWNTLKTSNSSPITLTSNNNPSRIKYFRVELTDNCGNKLLQSNISNNIVLQKSATTELTYFWNDYATWPSGIREYQLIIGDENATVSTWNVYKTFATPPTEYKLPDNFPQDKCICALAIEKGPNALGYTDSSFSNIVCPFALSTIYIPNAFTPNQDGKNEVFTAISSALNRELSTMHIYNKWGTKIFMGTLKEGWNAYDLQNQKCPMGVYAYQIEAVSKNGERKMFQGTLTLIY